MNFEEVKNWIEENKDNQEVSDYINGISQPEYTVDGVEEFLNSEDGKKLLQPKLDKYHNKSLETWKKNNLDSLVEEEVKKRNPEKSDVELRMEKLEQELEQERNAKQRETIKGKAKDVAVEKQIPTSLIDYFVGDDEESTLENLSTFEEAMKGYVDSKVQERVKDTSYTPPSGDEDTVKTFDKPIEQMSKEEFTEYYAQQYQNDEE